MLLEYEGSAELSLDGPPSTMLSQLPKPTRPFPEPSEKKKEGYNDLPGRNVSAPTLNQCSGPALGPKECPSSRRSRFPPITKMPTIP